MAITRFQTADQLANEAARLDAVNACQMDFAVADPVLEGIVAEAAALFGTPIALISIVEQHVQRFRARVGLNAGHTGRNISFCAHALHSVEPLVVPDANQDKRFAGNPLVVGPPYIRAYFGAPLIARSGLALGTLCVIDTKPREATREQLEQLKALAARVTTRLEAGEVP